MSADTLTPVSAEIKELARAPADPLLTPAAPPPTPRSPLAAMTPAELVRKDPPPRAPAPAAATPPAEEFVRKDPPPSAPAAPLPYQAMLRSTAYERMRAEHPAEFAPASVFFTHDPRSAIDRRNSFRVKAALVYEAVTGHHVDDHMTLASSLLLALAKECHSRINPGDAAAEGEGDARAPEAGNAPPSPDSKGSNNKPSSEPTDEGWDEKRKRVVDAIFLVVGFLPKLKEAIDKNTDRDGVDESFKSRHMQDIVTDVIKLENQLPLRDLLDVAFVAEAAVNATVARGEFKDVVSVAGAGGEYKLPYAIIDGGFGDIIHGFCWYYSPFASSKRPSTAVGSPFKEVAGDEAAAARTTLLDCLHTSVVRPPPPAQGGAGAGGAATGRPSRMPTARELRRSGVRVQASESGRAEVEFSPPAARLPALVFDFKLATVARNLLAREYEEERRTKPVTRYFQMMNEIVEDAADVRVLRRAGVIRGGGSGGAGDQEVLALVKGIDGHATYPSVYMAMDREIEKVRKYYDQRMKSFFVRNRPGVIWASSVAAISVVAIVAARRNRG